VVSTLIPNSPLLTIRETAERLTISEKTVRRLIDAGVLPAVRVSAGAIRVEQAELDEWLQERRTSSTAGGSSPFSPPSVPAACARDPEASGSRARSRSAGAT
jgi:excisionase family DNA binding protein